jgi:hypothetical protein
MNKIWLWIVLKTIIVPYTVFVVFWSCENTNGLGSVVELVNKLMIWLANYITMIYEALHRKRKMEERDSIWKYIYKYKLIKKEFSNKT